MTDRPTFVGYIDYTEEEKMPDVVVSLRKVTKDGWDSDYLLCVLCEAAADEIERLRGALRTLVGASECFLSSEVVDETGGTFPLMNRLERAIEEAKAVL